MRHIFLMSASLLTAFGLSACGARQDDNVERALQDINVVDESNLNDVILNSTDPNEAVRYFQRALDENPDRIDLQRSLALSMTRAKRWIEAKPAWQKVALNVDATNEDKINYANSLVRTNDWDGAKAALNTIPPTYETYERYRLEAIIADSSKDWARADSFYETAIGLTTRPSSVMNNWGFSQLTRGNYSEAERLFGEALRQDNSLFTTKNNLVLARGAQRNYTLPVMHVTQTERAQLLHTMALTAIKQGDVNIGEGLLREAISTHPQHFEAATQALTALERG